MSENNNQYFFNFSFFKVDPKWRWMADLAKEESAKEVENIITNSGIMFRSYSNLGLRDDADFLFWFAAKTVDEIQNVIEKLYKTVFGKYIISSMTYLSCTRPSIYVKEPKVHGFITESNPKKHVIVYPFTKTRDWYLLSKEKRQKIMDEHIEVSKKYPQVVLNTTYSFGIHDEDFMLAFEVDDIRDFQDLIMDLRETEVSTYVKNDIPMIVCVKKDIIPLITSLG
ncbi:MAG TPA: chlorite dismutase family protein [Nitrosopumilus sp.]|nr:chlorite dismutase family protein [Nitrosopumilus sp.]HJM79364.1 chlorite dismutase family protein [Nitrosopumilus sp.]